LFGKFVVAASIHTSSIDLYSFQPPGADQAAGPTVALAVAVQLSSSRLAMALAINVSPKKVRNYCDLDRASRHLENALGYCTKIMLKESTRGNHSLIQAVVRCHGANNSKLFPKDPLHKNNRYTTNIKYIIVLNPCNNPCVAHGIDFVNFVHANLSYLNS